MSFIEVNACGAVHTGEDGHSPILIFFFSKIARKTFTSAAEEMEVPRSTCSSLHKQRTN